MDGAELVELDDAAQAFGVTRDVLEDRLEGGSLPEAVKNEESWVLPTGALPGIANREGWHLDLTGRRRGPNPMPEQLDRYISETLAAHAAVVLAKTQAAAARAEVQELSGRLRRVGADLDAERDERQRLSTSLAQSERQKAELDKNLAVSEARADEVRSQLNHERSQRALLTQRIGMLEKERDDLYASLGWLGRRRLQISRQGLGRESGPPRVARPRPPTGTPMEVRPTDHHVGRP